MKNLINKFLKKENGVKEDKKMYNRYSIDSEIIYTNQCVEIAHDSCKICYGRDGEPTYEAKSNYIRRQIGHGHESILEHTNVISTITIPEIVLNNEDLFEFLGLCRYLNVRVKKNAYEDTVIILGGSIRGYKHIVRNGDLKNTIIDEVLNIITELNSCFFTDLIKDNILSSELFLDLAPENRLDTIKSTEKYDILHIDNLEYIQEKLCGLLTEYELMDFVTINLLIKDVSRVCSHQLVRHRAGITQLSQRYVDMTGATFISPGDTTQNVEDYTKYLIDLGDSKKEFNAQELGDFLCTIYPQLRAQGMLKEDARAYLPNNTNTSLYMTFTWRGLIKFLELRTDKHSQAEIRNLATDLEIDFDSIISSTLSNNIYSYIMPLYTYEEEFCEMYNIDEELECFVEEIEE